MVSRAWLSVAVMFLRDLDVSAGFCTGLLWLQVTGQAPTVAALVSEGGSELPLGLVGRQGERPLGSAGVQHVVWRAVDKEGLQRMGEALKNSSASRQTRTGYEYAPTEGRDPDDVAVLARYPGPDDVPLRKLPARVDGW